MQLKGLKLFRCTSAGPRYAVILGTVLALLPGAVLAAPPSPLDPASPSARAIAALHNVTLWIAGIVFLIVGALLVYSLVRFRRRSVNDPEPDQSFHGSAVLETIWTLIPVGILVTLVVLTFQTLKETDSNRDTDMTIRAIGKQWLWEFQYPDYDIQMIGELRVPVNTDITIELTSEDVIHSFWVPQLGGKKDAVPGYLTTTWFKAEKEGTYYGQCAEYCGLGHSAMPIQVIVMDQASFDAWVAETAASN